MIIEYDVTRENGTYNYTQDLLALEEKRPNIAPNLPLLGKSITSPLIVSNWRSALQSHPDQAFVQYILQGLTHGFHVGFDRGVKCKSSRNNMRSALENPYPVDEYLAEELQAGRIVGPLDPAHLDGAQVSRFGVIPKTGQPNKWRLILDLSSPREHSVNDGISKSLCSLRYTSVEDAVQRIWSMGKGTLLAKIDIAHAYRNIPVHAEDRLLLVMQWREKFYMDTVLPFGLRSAPKIFSAVADALEWILLQAGVTFVIHYLDDYLTMGKKYTKECENNLALIQKICAWLGFPLKVEKMEGPTEILIFLGILIDTLRMELRLPPDKLIELKNLVDQWKSKQASTKRQLLSLIGKLAHAAKIVKPGRTFLRRMLDVAHSVKDLNHYVKLKSDFKSDLAWWECFLEQWNGLSMMETLHHNQAPAAVWHTDASGSWGCGAYWGGRGRWIQAQWSKDWQSKNITLKEMIPIVLATAMWGRHCSHKHVLVYCDNMAVVQMLASKTSREQDIMHLLRCLHFFTALFDMNLKVVHLAGKLNVMADSISRNSLQNQQIASCHMQPSPDPIHPSLWQLLVTIQPDWTCVNWKELLKSCARQA